ncbi:MAG: 2-phosphosulfolactate phosphatase [Betaproteobacteria bacterium]|nr:2-phosphosulfolactate phosphatase [Betaproteobacteria bacterium]
MTVQLNHKVHVLFRREDIDMVRLENKVVIVLDVLFATSTMIAALAHGATTVVPTLDEAGARLAASGRAEGSYVLSGELYAETLPGFVSPTPLRLIDHGIKDKTLIYSTTNGTVALRHASAAAHVFAGALLNAGAVVKHIAKHHPSETILIICSGSMGNPNLEDSYGAGCFVDLIASEMGERDLSDASHMARAVYLAESAESALMRGRVGEMMHERQLLDEVRYAARVSHLDVVPKLLGTELRAI